MANRTTGRFERTSFGGETVAAFVPFPLPPADPPLVLDGPVGERNRQAEQALARLELAGDMVPSLDGFLYSFVRKEAVLSAQIEGTQATLVDLLTFEAATPDAGGADVEEVCSYIDALTFARAQLRDPNGLPLSMRLLSAVHARLLRGVRGGDKQAGEVRRSQNWIGGSRPSNALFVPPPPDLLGEVLGDFERYLHRDDPLPPLVRAGLLHAQFETIHPYLDGNGRMGRLLVTLLLEHWQLLSRPMLYLSLFLKQHRDEYVRRLDAVRRTGDWEGWLDFFLDGVATIADESVAAARELYGLVVADRARLLQQAGMSLGALQLFEQLPLHPIVTVAKAIELFRASKPTATKAVRLLQEAGVLVEITGRKRDRSFAYGKYLDRLKVGTELEGIRR